MNTFTYFSRAFEMLGRGYSQNRDKCFEISLSVQRTQTQTEKQTQAHTVGIWLAKCSVMIIIVATSKRVKSDKNRPLSSLDRENASKPTIYSIQVESSRVHIGLQCDIYEFKFKFESISYLAWVVVVVGACELISHHCCMRFAKMLRKFNVRKQQIPK